MIRGFLCSITSVTHSGRSRLRCSSSGPPREHQAVRAYRNQLAVAEHAQTLPQRLDMVPTQTSVHTLFLAPRMRGSNDVGYSTAQNVGKQRP